MKRNEQTIRQIVFTKANVAEYLVAGEADFSKLGDHDVAVKTFVSTVSPGTERANLTGDPCVSSARDAKPEVSFPRYTGYSSAGEVVAVGKAVTKLKIGDRAAVYWGQHKSYNIVNENNAVKIENEKISYEEAAIAFISTFPLAAIRKVRLELGESLMVMGLGLLGQIAVMYARAAGAYPVIACDPIEQRRDEALKNGADYAFDPLDKDFEKNVRAVCCGVNGINGVNAAIEVTGVGAGLNETLDCMAKFGRVALLGCTRSSDFTVDYYHKVHGPGITLIGAHTRARPECESAPFNFTHADDIRTALKLCGGGRLPLKNLIKETHAPEDCGEVYVRLARDKDFPVCVQFDWRNA